MARRTHGSGRGDDRFVAMLRGLIASGEAAVALQVALVRRLAAEGERDGREADLLRSLEDTLARRVTLLGDYEAAGAATASLQIVRPGRPVAANLNRPTERRWTPTRR